MPRLIDRVPIAAQDDVTFLRTEQVRIRAYEVIVWVSLSVQKVLELPPGTARFPAILDTAHTHYFSLQEQHLLRWAGIRPELLDLRGHVRQAGRRVPLRSANLWLHRNVRGERDQLRDMPPHLLRLRRGISVYPDDAQFPRLPLLGLRVILDNHLHLAVDGERKWANLHTPDWRTKLLRWLG